MRVLVTGGAGYIGSVLTDALVARGDDVVVYDNLSTGHRDAVSSEATLVEGSILDGAKLGEALRGAHAVVHMAARSIIGDPPEETRRDNVTGSETLIAAMQRAGVGILVFSSTASVYGEPAKQPIDEDDPTAPINAYGETKLAVERALASSGLRFTCLRYFNAAGATDRRWERHDPETHLIPRILHARGPIVVNGGDYETPDGTCIRDYVHVSDLAHAHILAMDALANGGPNRIYNVGGGAGASVREVIRTAEAVTGKTIPIAIGPRRVGDPAKLVASTKRIERELGWHPTRDLRTMIADVWNRR
jgi:UDP-glucose 4-epimerase